MRMMGVNYGCYNYKLFEHEKIHHIPTNGKKQESIGEFLEHLLEDQSWVDTRYLAIYVRMFKVGISVVSPYFTRPQEFFHNKKNPEIVLVVNGGGEGTDWPITHFIATRSK